MNLRFCQYFNNSEMWPFQEIGCMFKHEKSPQNKYKHICHRKLCQYQHKVSDGKIVKNVESKNCDMEILRPLCF